MDNLKFFGLLLAVSIPVVIGIGSIGLMIYGLYLAFSASVLFGILALIVEPTPLVLAVAAIFGHADLALKISQFLHLNV